mmetsp:Transcript_74288/g.187816  ORF Transcript_74288/g.187816 Transcript_74288/m.187816 type:complete len:128 (+) Transcript_74288:64-447(+)
MATHARSSGAFLLLLAVAAALLRWGASSPDFVGGAVAPAGLRGAAVARAAASAETAGKVADIIAEQLGVDKEKVIREATLTELGADSLDIVESVMALEEGFDVELPDEETTALKNVGDVMDLIETKL